MNYKFKTKPYQHQLDALEISWNKEVYAYFMEMGTGKTKVLIDNMSMLYDNGKIDGALIIAPKGVVGTWYEQELPTHLVNHVENVTILWQSNITKKPAVITTQNKDKGKKTFQPSLINWSYLNLRNVALTQINKNTKKDTLIKNHI